MAMAVAPPYMSTVLGQNRPNRHPATWSGHPTPLLAVAHAPGFFVSGKPWFRFAHGNGCCAAVHENSLGPKSAQPASRNPVGASHPTPGVAHAPGLLCQRQTVGSDCPWPWLLLAVHEHSLGLGQNRPNRRPATWSGHPTQLLAVAHAPGLLCQWQTVVPICPWPWLLLAVHEHSLGLGQNRPNWRPTTWSGHLTPLLALPMPLAFFVSGKPWVPIAHGNGCCSPYMSTVLAWAKIGPTGVPQPGRGIPPNSWPLPMPLAFFVSGKPWFRFAHGHGCCAAGTPNAMGRPSCCPTGHLTARH